MTTIKTNITMNTQLIYVYKTEYKKYKLFIFLHKAFNNFNQSENQAKIKILLNLMNRLLK
jgi:hypothetical protein